MRITRYKSTTLQPLGMIEYDGNDDMSYWCDSADVSSLEEDSEGLQRQIGMLLADVERLNQRVAELEGINKKHLCNICSNLRCYKNCSSNRVTNCSGSHE